MKDREGKLLLAISFLTEEYVAPTGKLLSNLVNLSEGAVSVTLQDLEKNDLIVREDERPKPNYLTEEGEKALNDWTDSKRGSTLSKQYLRTFEKRLKDFLEKT
ncbi:MAG: hypothetical protein ACFFD4_38415 [Candidatus Odinarchaeota archaeon]